MLQPHSSVPSSAHGLSPSSHGLSAHAPELSAAAPELSAPVCEICFGDLVFEKAAKFQKQILFLHQRITDAEDLD